MRATIITRSKTFKPTNNDNDENTATTSNHNDIFFERKIEDAIAGLAPYYSRVLSEKVSKEKCSDNSPIYP
jgi:hypothetical protein